MTVARARTAALSRRRLLAVPLGALLVSCAPTPPSPAKPTAAQPAPPPATAAPATASTAQSPAGTPTSGPAVDPAKLVKVLHAGSLNNLVQKGLTPALLGASGLVVQDQFGGSVVLANGIKDHSMDGDV